MDHDVFVIGTGTAGYTTAAACSGEGLDVAIADRRKFGGTCARRGCVPKKVLHECMSVVNRSRNMSGRGISSASNVNWTDLMEFKRSFTEPIPEKRIKDLDELGITAYRGRVSFIGENEISVGGDRVSAERIVVATGARPRTLGIPGEEKLLLSEDVLELDELPSSLLFIGGGYISFELASVFNVAGCDVTIAHRSKRPLRQFDSEHVGILMDHLRKEGVKIYLDLEAKGVRSSGNGVEVICENARGTEMVLYAEGAVHGAGRVPQLDDLDLEKGNVNTDRKGIVINDNLQSVSNPSVYVAGDANGRGIPLKLPAEREADIVVENVARGNSTSYPDIPAASVLYTIPSLASVGRGKVGTKEENIMEMSGSMARWNLRRMRSERTAAYRIFFRSDSHEIVGADLMGENVDEVINIFVLAVEKGITGDELKRSLWAFPSLGSDIRIMLGD